MSARIKFKEYAANWLEKKIKVQKTKSTYNNYRRNLNIHFYPVVGNIFMDQVCSKHADKIIQNLLETDHNENGVNKIMQTFRTILLDAEKTDAIRKSPMRNYPILKVKRLPPKFWSHMEIRQFLQANRQDKFYPVYVVALNTGMRKGELAGLSWDRIDFQRSMIEVSRIRGPLRFKKYHQVRHRSSRSHE